MVGCVVFIRGKQILLDTTDLESDHDLEERSKTHRRIRHEAPLMKYLIFVFVCLGSLQLQKIPQVYVSKYNRFVDTIINRINRILGKSYDPVRVKLPSSAASSASKTKNTNRTKSKKHQKRRKNGGKSKNRQNVRNKMAELTIARAIKEREPAFVLIAKNSDNPTQNKVILQNSTILENRAVPKKQTKKTNKKRNQNTKQQQNKKTQKARATLFGLSSIRRDGDVSVNMETNHTTVKTNFMIGPLTLRVEREVRILPFESLFP